MKFLVDAQLPKRFAIWLTAQGHDVVHTLDLPDKNQTSDAFINELSIREKRVVISKDSDFFNRYFMRLEPFKLIYLTTGNISTQELITLFQRNLKQIEKEIETNNVIEINKTSIITID